VGPTAYLNLRDHQRPAFHDLVGRIAHVSRAESSNWVCGPGNLTETLGHNAADRDPGRLD